MKKAKNITWDDLPINIQKAMIRNYISQKKDICENKDIIKSAVSSFRYNLSGGFVWNLSPESSSFWIKIIGQNNIAFFKQYYKNNIAQYLIDYDYF